MAKVEHAQPPYSTPADRAAHGKQARANAPRSSHAELSPRANRDPLGTLAAQDRSRVPELVPIRYGRMLASPFAFFRGAAAVMAADLATSPAAGLAVQLCGDAHLLNFGGFASPERSLVFDLNDFDETLPGPFEWDVKRLAASFELAARERDFDGDDRANAVLAAVRSYRKAMREFAAMGELDVWYARLDANAVDQRLRAADDPRLDRVIAKSEKRAYAHDRMRALAKLTHDVDDEPRFVSHPPLVVPIAELDEGMDESFLRTLFRRYRKTLPVERRTLIDRYRYGDLARKVVGIGSVGTRCWVMLLAGRDNEDPLFLQIKEAESSALAPWLGRSTSASDAERVVQGQRLLQAASDIFLGWIHSEEDPDGRPRDYYVRQLWDWKTSVDLETIPADGLVAYASVCGWTLARAHARSGDRIAIAAYLGRSDRFERAVADFAVAYADVNERDHRALADAVAAGRIAATAA